MQAKKNSFLLRISSYTREIDSLSLEQLGEMLKAIYAHAGAEHATMPELSPLLRMALAPIFNEMDSAAAEYEAVCKKRAAGGKLGGRTKEKKIESKPQGIENNLKVTQGTSRGHEGSQGGLSKHKNPDNEYEYDYDNEYETPCPVKERNILDTTYLDSSIEENGGNLKVGKGCSDNHKVTLPALSSLEVPYGSDDPPDDYDPSSLVGGMGLNGEDFDSPF